MTELFAAYRPLIDLILISIGFAYSQYVVLRAGSFSVGTAGFAALGAYAAAIANLRLGMPLWSCIAAGMLIGSLAAAVLSIPLARLRGVFQAIATLAFVQIVIALNLYAEPLTGGASGINNIPKLIDTSILIAVLAIEVYLLHCLSSLGMGRAFDALRQDETVAVSLGISVSRYHTAAFAISGALAGLNGSLLAFNSYTLIPEQFGFGFLVASIASVVLGGAVSILGPIVGTVVLTTLPEFARAVADQRFLLNGAVLMLVMVYLPHGIVDTLKLYWRTRMTRRAALADSGVGA